MTKTALLFIQGGGEGAYDEDKKLAVFLADNLKDQYKIEYPRMPDEGNPNYETYKAKILEELKKIDTKVVLVGHSVGGCFLLKYLSEEKIDNQITGIFLIATPFWGKEGWQHEGFRLSRDFAQKLPVETPMFFYHGTDDETVPFSHLALYEKELPRARFRKIAGRGHQLDNDLAEVVQDIRSVSNNIPG
ncbi:MAG: alpha/beta hydrolase [Williamsia sp.]|nr:alpha/beta hydrolase [Williamsia sp.]